MNCECDVRIRLRQINRLSLRCCFGLPIHVQILGKVPSVVTSDLWKNYHNAKENHKQKQKEQVELRRLQREKRKKAQKKKNEKKIKKGKQTKSKKDASGRE
jgi:hypothetical protein